MKKTHGTIINLITNALNDFGPMSTTELCETLSMQKDEISSVLSRMKVTTPQREQRVHIVGYTYDAEGSRRYPRAIYAVGAGENVPHPKPDPKGNRARHEANKRKKINSVWMLGANRATRKSLGFPV